MGTKIQDENNKLRDDRDYGWWQKRTGMLEPIFLRQTPREIPLPSLTDQELIAQWLENFTPHRTDDSAKASVAKINLIPILLEVEDKEEREFINQLMGSSNWVLVDQFTQGHSPTRLYLVRSFEESKLHVLKVGRTPVIDAEYQRFQQSEHWRTLPEMAQLRHRDIRPDSKLSGLDYDLAGNYKGAAITLGQYLRIVKPPDEIRAASDQTQWLTKKYRSIVGEVLAKALPAWRPSSLKQPKRFTLIHSFDRALPVSLELELLPKRPDGEVVLTLDGHTNLNDLASLKPGQVVSLNNFIVEEIKHTETYVEVTLNMPRSQRSLKENPEEFRSRRIRLQVSWQAHKQFQEGQEIKQKVGRVINTRLSHFQTELAQLPELVHFNLSAEQFQLNELGEFPNPFLVLTRVIQEYFNRDQEVFVTEIHGDFHFHNIMVARNGGYLISFIDPARVRYDYVLHDFLKLELSLITGLMKQPDSGTVLANVVNLYTALHKTWEINQIWGDSTVKVEKGLQPLAAAILKIRQTATPFLYSQDYNEYYAGLLIYLLSSLKFELLDTVHKTAAFGAALVVAKLLEAANTPN